MTTRGTSKMLVIFFLKPGAGFMGVLTLLNLIELFACDSCPFLYVGFTSIKSFLKTIEDESGELDLEVGKYAVKTLASLLATERASPAGANNVGSSLGAILVGRKLRAPGGLIFHLKTFFYLLIGELHPAQQ